MNQMLHLVHLVENLVGNLEVAPPPPRLGLEVTPVEMLSKVSLLAPPHPQPWIAFPLWEDQETKIIPPEDSESKNSVST